MRRVVIATLGLLLVSGLLATGCKYKRENADQDVPPTGAKGALLDEQGQPIMPSEAPGAAPAEKGGDEAANLQRAELDKGRPADIRVAQANAGEAAKPEPGDLPAPADVAAPPTDAQKTQSGLASKVLKPGTGTAHPTANDTVKVHYTGWTTDGKMFDSSVKRGQPAEFPLSGVIPGWTEGVQLMTIGETRRFWIPEELAYKGRPGAPQGMLVFDVELLEIKTAPKPPMDVSAPPADAEKTASGLASKVLKRGTGTMQPKPDDVVKVHYSGWTTDGKLFDSSVTRGEPASFPLNRVIPGWTEGVALMVEGEKRMLWIPEELAYKGAPGAPAGMLVFEVDLLEITRAPEAPADVAAPPADAEKAASGLASKVLQPGTGKDKPGPEAMVEVHYSGWTTDGKMFDSSVMRGKPAKFRLNAVIPGWTEGVGLMVVGEKRRLWIPEEMAYKGQPGRPAGMLVFDVELVSIGE